MRWRRQAGVRACVGSGRFRWCACPRQRAGSRAASRTIWRLNSDGRIVCIVSSSASAGMFWLLRRLSGAEACSANPASRQPLQNRICPPGQFTFQIKFHTGHNATAMPKKSTGASGGDALFIVRTVPSSWARPKASLPATRRCRRWRFSRPSPVSGSCSAPGNHGRRRPHREFARHAEPGFRRRRQRAHGGQLSDHIEPACEKGNPKCSRTSASDPCWDKHDFSDQKETRRSGTRHK